VGTGAIGEVAVAMAADVGEVVVADMFGWTKSDLIKFCSCCYCNLFGTIYYY
jgi:hypothetical protein